MIFAVVEAHAEIHHRKSRQKAALGRIAHALFHRRNPVLGNRAAENIVHELDSRAARQRLHLDAAHAELPVAAGLLLVLAFGVGLAANRLAVGNLGRLERQLHVIALAQLRDHHFDVLLPRAAQQKFLGLRIARRSAAPDPLREFCGWPAPMRSSSARVFGSMAKVIEGSGMRAGG